MFYFLLNVNNVPFKVQIPLGSYRPIETLFPLLVAELGQVFKMSVALFWMLDPKGWSEMNRRAVEAQETLLRSKIVLSIGQCEMERCNYEVSICLQCPISRELLFSAFQGCLYKNLDGNLFWRNKIFGGSSPFVKNKKQISIDLIFDLLIRAFFGRGVCSVPLFTLPLGLRMVFINPHWSQDWRNRT